MIIGFVKLGDKMDAEVKATIEAYKKIGVNGDLFYAYLKGRGVSDTQFVEWSKKLSADGAEKVGNLIDNGHTIDEIDYIIQNSKKFDEVVDVGKDSDQEIKWLEKGYYNPAKGSGWGWDKIIGKHWAEGNFVGAFSSSVTQDMVKSEIFETMKSAATTKIILDNGDKIKYTKTVTNPETNKNWIFVVVVSNKEASGIGKGNIITAYAKRIGK